MSYNISCMSCSISVVLPEVKTASDALGELQTRLEAAAKRRPERKTNTQQSSGHIYIYIYIYMYVYIYIYIYIYTMYYNML